MYELNINNYIDWEKMWSDALEIHLGYMSSKERYIEEMEDVLPDLDFVEQMYDWLIGDNSKTLVDFKLNNDIYECYITPVKDHHSDKEITFEFSKIEYRSSENGWDESGVSVMFTYHTGDNCFTNFKYYQW